MKKIAVATLLGGAIISAGVLASPAGADSNTGAFLRYSEHFGGVTHGNAEIQQRAIDLGYALCDFYRVGGTYQGALNTLQYENEIYAAAAPLYLCSDQQYVLPR